MENEGIGIKEETGDSIGIQQQPAQQVQPEKPLQPQSAQTAQNSQQKNVTITYETLYELFRREKNRPELQDLPETFFKDVLEYVREKRRFLEESQQKLDIFSEGEKQKTQLQLTNIKKLIKDLYERREKKIVDMAINKSRTGSDIINTSNLLEVERNMFDVFVSFLNRFRQGIVNNIVEAREPESSVEMRMQEAKAGLNLQNESIMGSTAENTGASSGVQAGVQAKETKMVRFINPVPKFVGKELEVYGPFEEEDISSLPAELADVLIKKGRAEEINEEQS
jgi:DNA replication initiation complex subunit (GINS family)